jgi:hypothetical protein
MGVTLNLYSKVFIACANSVDPNDTTHSCCLIKIYTVCFMVRNKLMNKKTNSVDPDQTAVMSLLIWIYIVCPWITAICQVIHDQEGNTVESVQTPQEI